MNKEVTLLTTKALLALLLAAAMLLSGCPSPGYTTYNKATRHLQAQEYGEALEAFELALEKQPDMKMGIFGKGRALYELARYEEALATFEDFLAKTKDEPAAFQDQRYDAEFYRDKCKLELGMEVEQNERAIPPPPMGE